MHLNCQHQHQVHDGHRRKTEEEVVGLAVAIELLCRREHLHAAINEGNDGKEPHADHGQHQVANVVAGNERRPKRDGTMLSKYGYFH